MNRAIVWQANVCIQPALILMVKNRVLTTRALALLAARLLLRLQAQLDLKHAKTKPKIAKVGFVSTPLTILQMSWWIKPTLISACLTQTRMGASRMRK